MKYRATIRPITDTEELAPPDSGNAWTLHSFETGDDQLVVLWQFDDVLAKQKKERRVELVHKFAGLEGGMRNTERDLGHLVERMARDDTRADVLQEIDGIVCALRCVLREAGEGYGPPC